MIGVVKYRRKIERRNYLKYVGAAIGLGIAAAAGYGTSEMTRIKTTQLPSILWLDVRHG